MQHQKYDTKEFAVLCFIYLHTLLISSSIITLTIWGQKVVTWFIKLSPAQVMFRRYIIVSMGTTD